MPKKPVKFGQVPRDEQLKLAEEELKAAMMSFVRGDVHAMLFQGLQGAHSGDGAPGDGAGGVARVRPWQPRPPCDGSCCASASKHRTRSRCSGCWISPPRRWAWRKTKGCASPSRRARSSSPRSWTSAGIPWKPSGKSSARFCGSSPASIPRRACAATSSEASTPKIRETRLEVLEILESLMERHGLDVVERGEQGARRDCQARRGERRGDARRRLQLPRLRLQGGRRGRVEIHRSRGRTDARRAGRQVRQGGEGDGPKERRQTGGVAQGRTPRRQRNRQRARRRRRRSPVPAAPWARFTRDPSPRPVASPRLPRPWDRPSPPPQPPCSDPSARRCPPSSRDEETPRKRPTRPSLSRQPRRCPRRIELGLDSRAGRRGERERRGGCGGYEGDVPRDYGGGWGCGDARGDGARRRSPRRSSRQTHLANLDEPLLRLDHPPPARASTSSTPSCRCSRSPRWRRLSGRRTSV